MKALLPIKASVMEDEAEWFAGKMPRRLLAIPFGGPIPSPKSSLGVDLDGEFFDERTDIFGAHRFLRTERERIVDWHHKAEPAAPSGQKVIGDRVIGKGVLDLAPDDEGWWLDFWFKAGQDRTSLIRKLAERGTQLFGSSQPYAPDVKKANGHISVWPFIFETISPSPQNTWSVIRPKALLDDAREAGITVSSAFRALLADAVALDASLADPSLAVGLAKSGRELSEQNLAELDAMVEDWRSGYYSGMLRLKDLIARVRSKYMKETTDG